MLTFEMYTIMPLHDISTVMYMNALAKFKFSYIGVRYKHGTCDPEGLIYNHDTTVTLISLHRPSLQANFTEETATLILTCFLKSKCLVPWSYKPIVCSIHCNLLLY